MWTLCWLIIRSSDGRNFLPADVGADDVVANDRTSPNELALESSGHVRVVYVLRIETMPSRCTHITHSEYAFYDADACNPYRVYALYNLCVQVSIEYIHMCGCKIQKNKNTKVCLI